MYKVTDWCVYTTSCLPKVQEIMSQEPVDVTLLLSSRMVTRDGTLYSRSGLHPELYAMAN